MRGFVYSELLSLAKPISVLISFICNKEGMPHYIGLNVRSDIDNNIRHCIGQDLYPDVINLDSTFLNLKF